MGVTVFLALLFAAAPGTSATGAAARSNVTPLQKLVEMLSEMTAKGKAEKQAEQVEFAKFDEWCDGLIKEKTKSISDAAVQMEELEAVIQKETTDAAVLAEEIKELEAKIAKAEAELASATSVRGKEKADYDAQHKDLSESISACDRAISVLKSRGADVPQSLAQVQASRFIPAEAKAVIKSFISLSTEEMSAAPEANAYEFQSGGVVSLLEKLRKDFRAQLTVVEKEEMAAKGNFQVLKQQLTDDIEFDNKEVGQKTERKAAALELAASSKADLATTTASKKEDEKVLSETKGECALRSQEFEDNQVTRAEEIRAIETAVGILSSGSVKGNADTYLPTLVQVHSTSLVQGNSHWSPAARRAVVEMLQAKARATGSRALALVAEHASSDPFAKVKKMIKDLIVKLMEQTNAEADQHAYCTTELATNKETRSNKEEEVEQLTSLSEQLTAESAKLSSEITELSDAIAEIKASQAQATKVRQEEKAVNTKTVADAKEAILAVEKATQVLKDFYSNAKEGALLQGGQGLRAEMQQAEKVPYKGMQATSGGIFGMLEVVLSDFSRLEAQTSHDESAAAAAYEKYMNEADEDVAVKTAEVEHKTGSRALADEKNAATKKELALTQEELEKAMDYYDKLKEECVDTGLSYEDRKKAREEEIQSLKEALAILQEQDLA
jgi:hypothetical protein